MKKRNKEKLKGTKIGNECENMMLEKLNFLKLMRIYHSYNFLYNLQKSQQKPKSKFFEEAIRELKKREDILEARMKKILGDKKGALLELNKLLDDADEINKEIK